MTNHTDETILNRLIQDCITYRLHDKDAQQYIKSYTGKKLSQGYISKKKKEVESEPKINLWLNHHTRIGFIRDHKSRMDEMEKVQGKLMNLFLTETNVRIIALLSERIESINTRLSELNLGSPIIAQIKQKMEVANTGEITSRVSDSPEIIT